MNAAIYARKSNAQDVADELKSITQQVALARKFAEARGWTVARIFEDDAISGAVEDRPGVVALRLALAERPRPFDVVITADASRLGREMDATFRLQMSIAKTGAKIVYFESGREPDFGTAIGKLTAQIDNFGSEQYREAIATKTRAALRGKAERGEATSGAVYGYTSVREAGPNGRPGPVRRVINEEQAAVVRRVFTLAAEGLGILRIQNALRADRVPAPARSVRGWAKSCIREFLHQELYRGQLVYGKTRNIGYSAEGRILREAVPESEWITVERPELRIVSEELWQATHARLNQTRVSYLHGRGGQLIGKPESGLTSKHLLSGFLICGICHGALRVDTRSFNRSRRPAYICANRKDRGRDVCTNRYPLMASLIEAAVVADLKEFLTPERFAALLEHAARASASVERLEADRVSIKSDLAKVNRELANLTAAIAGGLAVESLRTAVRDRELTRGDLERELRKLETVAATVRDHHDVLASLRQQFADWRAVLSAAPTAARQLLRKLIVGPIAIRPHFDGGSKCFEYAGVGALDGLLHGAVGVLTWNLSEKLGLGNFEDHFAAPLTTECSTCSS